MKEAIRQHARELGFDDCRFTTAEPPQSAARLEQWLATGQHGEMSYMERTARKRADLQQVLPGARSIITLAVSYAPNGEGSRIEDRGAGHAADCGARTAGFGAEATQRPGVMARFACYADYHQVLGPPLQQLAALVNQLGGAHTRSLWYVDTGSLLERDLAQRAGLGFIGKHTNLISRHLGNWIFLCEIITTFELEPDAPERNRCGSCTRCIAACPTAAITAPFQLDARLCISYLTIELRGPIPANLRPGIGDRIFGCDDCLAACPWNRFAREGRLMKTHARPHLTTLDLRELLALDDPEFKRRFAGTPLLRARRTGLLRNVCVALGNTGDETHLTALQSAATNPDPIIMEHAAWAIGQIQNRRGN